MRRVYTNMKLHYNVPNHRRRTDGICVGARRKTKEPPAIVGKTKADRALTRFLQQRLQRGRPADQQDQVAQLSQVLMCLCSLGNYDKYYCSLLPLTELSAVTWGTE